jgi:hypothetical protein
VHVGFQEVHHTEILDRPVRPTPVPQEVVQRVPVVVPDDRVPGRVTVACHHRAQLADRFLPQLVGGAATFGVGDLEGERGRVGVRFLDGHPHPANVHQSLGVAHEEGPQRQAELLAVADREVVGAGDPHRACLGVQAGRERTQRVDASTDPVLGLEHDDVVALPLQFMRGHQTGDPGTDDDDSLALPATVLEAAGRNSQDGVRHRWRQVRPRLRRRVRHVRYPWVHHQPPSGSVARPARCDEQPRSTRSSDPGTAGSTPTR